MAGEFIKQFDYLVSDSSIVVAPEALSRSYFGTKIGASWMTKEDRENEIADYVEYLDNLLTELRVKLPKDVKVNILGFSQGVHTAVRWFVRSKYQFENLVLCSSDFPRDVSFDLLKEKLNSSKMHFMCGDEDEFIPMDSFESAIKFLDEQNIPVERYRFKGRHVVNHDIIKKIAGA
jgi:predicted esterase